MNFHLFCTLINLGFIFFMFIKNIRKGSLFSNDDNNYSLIVDEFHYSAKNIID